MVTIFLQFFFNFFSQEYFTFSKNGQKKCPKMKITEKSWKKIKLLIFHFSLSYFKNIYCINIMNIVKSYTYKSYIYKL